MIFLFYSGTLDTAPDSQLHTYIYIIYNIQYTRTKSRTLYSSVHIDTLLMTGEEHPRRQYCVVPIKGIVA